MIYSILIMTLAFIWLGYETDWMRVRLPVGVSKPKRNPWLDKAIICRNCHSFCEYRPKDRWLCYELPTRTVKLFSSTINFFAGCNYKRARLLRDIVKAQKSKATAHYPTSQSRTYVWQGGRFEPSIDISVDGELKLSVNSDYKHGVIKTMMRQHCVPGEGKIRLVKVK